jgi:N-acetylneuraminate synthase/N,N'-diacetyllegionaminate synthase
MDTLVQKFKLPVGYSDHTKGIEVAITAVARGAYVIEKHFTLDKNLPGPDHRASLEPEDLRKMIQSIRNVEKALGNGVKRPRRCELEIRKIARKSLVAVVDIKAGSTIARDMISIKRPGTGIEPKYYGRLIGKKSRKFIRKDQLLHWSQLI